MLADFLGMAWWSILLATGGFIAGVLLASAVKRIIKN